MDIMQDQNSSDEDNRLLAASSNQHPKTRTPYRQKPPE